MLPTQSLLTTASSFPTPPPPPPHLLYWPACYPSPPISPSSFYGLQSPIGLGAAAAAAGLQITPPSHQPFVSPQQAFSLIS